MGFFRLMMRSVFKPFANIARYLDLFLSVLLATLAWIWASPLLAAIALFSFTMFAIDLNGIMQRWAMRKAVIKSVGR